MITEKKQIIILIENENDDKFGGYINNIIYKINDTQELDTKSFHFHLQSNNKFQQPMKFEMNDIEKNYLIFSTSYGNRIIRFGDITLIKEDMKHFSYWQQNNNHFNYHNNNINVSCEGIINEFGRKCFIPKRIHVIQMI